MTPVPDSPGDRSERSGAAPRIDPVEYAELVLTCAEDVPPGRVTTYGSIAEAVGALLGGGGPRQVGRVMATQGGGVPWWRVVRSDGSLPESHDHRAAHEYRVEGTPLRASGRVDLAQAFWPAVVHGAPQPTSEEMTGE